MNSNDPSGIAVSLWMHLPHQRLRHASCNRPKKELSGCRLAAGQRESSQLAPQKKLILVNPLRFLKQNPLPNEEYQHLAIWALPGIDLISHVTASARVDDRSDAGPS